MVAIHTIKHTAFRIWAAALLSGPSTLLLLSLLDGTGGWAVPMGLLAALFALAYAGSGWLSSRLALFLLRPLLHEAGVWERSGDMDRAERVYRRALAGYESFLITPGARRRGIPSLVSRMARLYAAQTDRQADAEPFLQRYLETFPADRDIAETWLQTREYQGGLTAAQQELAVRIGSAHPDDDAIQASLARLFLQSQRTDFPALQTYRRALASPRNAASPLGVDLAQLFIAEGRSDEWALPVYLLAIRQQPSWEALRCGLAACLRWIPPSERHAGRLAEARNLLGRVDEQTLTRMSSGFVPPASGTPDTIAATSGEKREAVHGSLVRRLKAAALRLDRRRRHLGRRFRPLPGSSPKLRRILIGGLIAGSGLLAAMFLVNTVGYLKPSPPPEQPTAAHAPSAAPAAERLPYTLQVAAYVTPEHADRYLKVLRAQSVDAFVTQAYGSGKTWYQVRIAHFPDKAAALAYGSDLKARGVIEDFYVAMDTGS